MKKWHKRPQITAQPCVQFGSPCISGTRITVDAVAAFYRGERSTKVVAEHYGIRRADVLVALWYLARHGSRSERREWGLWAKACFEALWRSKWDDVPDPPLSMESA